jgi:hypothetical protein
MSASFGPFLLRHIRSDAVETEEQCLGILDQFARMGFCGRFREIIDGRVVEFHDGVGMPEDTRLYRWLDGDEAEAVLALETLGSFRPYSYFAFLDGLASLFTPDEYAEGGSASIDLATGDTYDFSAMPAPQAIRALERINKRLKGKEPDFWQYYDETPDTYLEFHTKLIEHLQRCSDAGVLYLFGG